MASIPPFPYTVIMPNLALTKIKTSISIHNNPNIKSFSDYIHAEKLENLENLENPGESGEPG
jgi:hypothetical protein